MVSTMASAYRGLSEAERERVFLLAVGLDDLKSADQAFCQGFAACPDDSDGSWWESWDADQRDVFFFTKKADGSWESYCQYSMNSNRDEFDSTIREMLTVVDLAIEDDDFVGNETDIGEKEKTEEEEATSASAQGDQATLNDVSSSSSYSNCVIFVTILAAVLGWSIV